MRRAVDGVKRHTHRTTARRIDVKGVLNGSVFARFARTAQPTGNPKMRILGLLWGDLDCARERGRGRIRSGAGDTVIFSLP